MRFSPTSRFTSGNDRPPLSASCGSRRAGERVAGEVAGERQRPGPAAALGRRPLDPHRCAGDRLVEDAAVGDEHGGVDVRGRPREPEIFALNSAAPSDSAASSERSAMRPSIVPSIVSPLQRQVAGRGQARAADRQVGDGDPPVGAGARPQPTASSRPRGAAPGPAGRDRGRWSVPSSSVATPSPVNGTVPVAVSDRPPPVASASTEVAVAVPSPRAVDRERRQADRAGGIAWRSPSTSRSRRRRVRRAYR